MTKRDGMTKAQREGMRQLACFDDGQMVAFGSGLGRLRLALRALHHRAKHLVEYEAKDGDEFFSITPAGRSALANAEKK